MARYRRRPPGVAHALRPRGDFEMKSLGNRVIPARARAALSARKSFSVLVVTAVSAAGVTAVAASGPPAAAASRHSTLACAGPSNDEARITRDGLRTGWDPNEPALTPAAVK